MKEHTIQHEHAGFPISDVNAHNAKSPLKETDELCKALSSRPVSSRKSNSSLKIFN